MRASTPVAGIVASLLLTLYPRAELYRVGADVERLILDPAPSPKRLDKLKSLLFDLADRPEWRGRLLVVRETSDVSGPRLEALLPLAPNAYRSGARLVGPFATEALADEWGGDHAVSTLSYDVFPIGSSATGSSSTVPSSAVPSSAVNSSNVTSSTDSLATDSVWLCDLFELPHQN